MFKKAVLVCCLVLGLQSLACPARGTPRLSINEAEFDFGYVPQNSRISHVFWLKSVGDDTLKILKVLPGCGCTKAPLENSALAPGDSTRLEVIFDTGRFQNRVTKNPRIETNDGLPQTGVHIISQVVSRPDSTYPITIKPYKLDFTQFGEKARDRIEFTISNVSQTDLEMEIVDRPEGYFDLELPREVKAGKSVRGALKLHDEAIEAPFEKSITIELSDETSTRFTVPVKRNK